MDTASEAQARFLDQDYVQVALQSLDLSEYTFLLGRRNISKMNYEFFRRARFCKKPTEWP